MGRRLDLQALLEDILGSTSVYFQPPPNVQMVYPCIVYMRDAGSTRFAGNRPYSYTQRYQVTLIDRNPDTAFLSLLISLPQCVYDRHYVADGLHHDVLVLYY